MTSNQIIRIILFAQRRPDLTEEQFHNYWGTTHAQGLLALPLFKKHLLKYEQFHDPDLLLGQAEAVLKLPPSGFTGCAVLTWDSVEGMKAALTDPAYFAFVKEDGPKFTNGTSRMRFFIPGAPEVMYQREGFSG